MKVYSAIDHLGWLSAYKKLGEGVAGYSAPKGRNMDSDVQVVCLMSHLGFDDALSAYIAAEKKYERYINKNWDVFLKGELVKPAPADWPWSEK